MPLFWVFQGMEKQRFFLKATSPGTCHPLDVIVGSSTGPSGLTSGQRRGATFPHSCHPVAWQLGHLTWGPWVCAVALPGFLPEKTWEVLAPRCPRPALD